MKKTLAASALAMICAWPTYSEVTPDIVISEFAKNVTKHVLYHELAHGLIREFDLPLLANEEAMADSFATSFIIVMKRDDAPTIVIDRVRSWIYEDSQVDPKDYDFKGEHSLDIRRAYQNACLLYNGDPAEWGKHIEFLEFSENDLSDCSDNPDQIEGWTKIVSPHLLPDGKKSEMVEVIYGDGPMKDQMMVSGLIEEFAEDVRRFNWPNPITVHFDHCDTGAAWSRENRTITLCDDYVARFVVQGEAIAK